MAGKGKRGPAPKGPYAGKSRVLSTRIREDTREALEQAAKARGRSLSQEIEERLRRTLTEDKPIVEYFGSRRIYAMMRLISAAMAMSENPALRDRPWLDDPYSYDQAVRAANAVFEALRPPGDRAPPDFLKHEREFNPRTPGWYAELWANVLSEAAKAQGAFNAEEMLQRVRNAPDAIPLTGDPVPSRIKSDLGDSSDRIRPERPIAENLKKRTKQHIKRAIAKRDNPPKET